MTKKLITVTDILADEDIKAMLNEFRAKDLPTTSQAILIWRNKDGQYRLTSAGFSGVPATIGTLAIVQTGLINDFLEVQEQ